MIRAHLRARNGPKIVQFQDFFLEKVTPKTYLVSSFTVQNMKKTVRADIENLNLQQMGILLVSENSGD